MLGKVSTRKAYRKARRAVGRSMSRSDWERVNKDPRLRAARNKLEFLRVDRAAPVLLPLYSPSRGRPATDPAVLVRSFLLMQHMGFTSIQRWVEAARADVALQWLVGASHVPSVGCHYDLVNRLTGDDPHMGDLYPEGLFTRALKELRKQYQLKKGEKMVNFTEGDTRELAERYERDASCDAGRWTLPLERLLHLVAVEPSMERYGIGAGCTLSGDGTALHIHASRFGHKVEDPPDEEHTTRYAAPDAAVGWDSDRKEFYLGFVLFNVSWHSRELGLDLPVHLTQAIASQHDALTCMVSFAHLLDVAPGLLPRYYCHDSAADAYPIFELMRGRGAIPIIDRNKRRSSESPEKRRPVASSIRDEEGNPLEHVNDMGVPVCAGGHEMCRDGYDRSKMATKYRCPCAVGRVKECERWGECTRSGYGRVVKTYDRTDLKLFGPVPYRSDEWKDIYKDRTCTERVNNRILNDYNLQNVTCRNGYKHFFLATMAAINIHLDAWVRTGAA